jgi:hypothetical protein
MQHMPAPASEVPTHAADAAADVEAASTGGCADMGELLDSGTKIDTTISQSRAPPPSPPSSPVLPPPSRASTEPSAPPAQFPPAETQRSPPKQHTFVYSARLAASLEHRRVRGKWAATRGIADTNASMVTRGGVWVERSTSSARSTPGDKEATPTRTWVPLPPVSVEIVPCPHFCTEAAPVPEPAQAPPAHTAAAGVGPGRGAVAEAAQRRSPPVRHRRRRRRFDTTEVAVANVDTVSAALELGDVAALNFANATTPGGRYVCGARAQEEDLCRLLPQLHPGLVHSGAYPLDPQSAVLARGLVAVREVGSYQLCLPIGEITVVTAAMPCGAADRRPRGGWLGSAWAVDVSQRIRAVLHAAAVAGHPNLVLGAFGCGAFGNPPGPVAALFKAQLQSPEFTGVFEKVVFAVLDPLGTGNLGPFRRSVGSQKAWA